MNLSPVACTWRPYHCSLCPQTLFNPMSLWYPSTLVSSLNPAVSAPDPTSKLTIFSVAGTSPLYVYSSTFSDGTPSTDRILGCASLIFWTVRPRHFNYFDHVSTYYNHVFCSWFDPNLAYANRNVKNKYSHQPGRVLRFASKADRGTVPGPRA